jgi:hypothetical protein
VQGDEVLEIVMRTGNLWVFLGIPILLPAKTPTRGNGWGFVVGLQEAYPYPYPQKPLPLEVGKGFLWVAEIVPASTPVSVGVQTRVSIPIPPDTFLVLFHGLLTCLDVLQSAPTLFSISAHLTSSFKFSLQVVMLYP